MQKINRRTALAATGASALALALAACGGSSTGSSTSAAADKLQAIKDAGKIRVGFEGTFAPWNYHNEVGELVGMEKEIADLIAADLGVESADLVVLQICRLVGVTLIFPQIFNLIVTVLT